MKLNLDIIQAHLSPNYSAKRYGLSEHRLTCPRPLLYTKNLAFQKEKLYISQAEALPKEPPMEECALIVIGTQLPKEWILSSTQLLVLSHTDHILSVFNDVNLLYDHFDQWEETLRDELEKELDFDLRKILFLGTNLLKRSISVVDRTLQNLFYLAYDQDRDGSPKLYLHEGSHPFSMEYCEKIKEVCNLERMITRPYLTDISLNEHSYCNNLFLEEQFQGCISVSEGKRPFTEGDFPLMDYFFAFFQKAFFKYIRNHGQKDTESLTGLRKLLNHLPLNDSEAEALSLEPNEYWLCFRLKEQRNQKYLPFEYMCANINALFPQKAFAVIQNREPVGLLRIRSDQALDILSFFEDFIQRMGYYGGVSNAFVNLNCFRDFLFQASYAAERRDPHSGFLCYFSDCAMQYLLFTCSREMEISSMLPAGLLALQLHDQKKNTEYVQTLSVYLNNERSITKTAAELFIHRSSLLKRLDKMQRILKDDLEHPQTRLYYQICLALLEKNEHF